MYLFGGVSYLETRFKQPDACSSHPPALGCYEKFRLAIVKGQDPDGTQLNTDMLRWNIGDDDLADLIVFLKTRP